MISPIKIMQDIKPAESLSDIFRAEDPSLFVGLIYKTLLRRMPDEEGFSFYLEQLNSGVNRKNVLVQIASSREARAIAVDLPGLDRLLKLHKLRSMFSFTAGNSRKTSLPKRQEAPDLAKEVAEFDHACLRASYVSWENFQKKFSEQRKSYKVAQVWFDLTTSMEWDGGVVGIIRAELEVAAGLRKLHPDIRFVTFLANGFVEIPSAELEWLFSAENVAEAYLQFFARGKNSKSSSGKVHLSIPREDELYFPFSEGDAVISMGWMDSRKEIYFGKVKRRLSDFFINYLVYDTILLNDETRRFYPVEGRKTFEQYLKWISENADFILYGGNTAKKDTERLQKEKGWPQRPGLPVKFGTDIVKQSIQLDEEQVLKSLGITGDFIITVGSIEPRKNHDTLYRAYLYALEDNGLDVPQLVICGKPVWRSENLIEFLERDPRVQGKIIKIIPTDQELALLYRRCLFTVLPSLYEGWSLTLPESLGQGKFCIATDTPPLREIGGELVEFVDGWDVKGWAEKISHYFVNRNVLQLREKRVQQMWPSSTWRETAGSIYSAVNEYRRKNKPKKLDPEIWIDLTTSYLQWRGGISGIVRAELTFARNIYESHFDVHFFAFDDGNFFEIDKSLLLWLLNKEDLAEQYAMFQNYWSMHESAGTGYRNPFATGSYPEHPAIIKKFPSEAIFLFLAIDFASGYKSRNERIAEIAKIQPGIFPVQLIYDFTPVLFPHLHNKETCERYLPFVEFVYNNFDYLVFGGRTAMADGDRLSSSEHWRMPQKGFVEFGSDVSNGEKGRANESDSVVLKKIGIDGEFLMTVGTIEPRKNHEMLYKAYLILRKRGFANLPQLVIVGKPGWKTEDFRAILEADDRIKGRILVISPTDDELDVLYRNCRFTLLPSFYEGWSLTLPESLSYGKFCLVSDVAPLRETGRELVEYLNPLDTGAWADRIAFYMEHAEELIAREKRIRAEWYPKSWKECSEGFMEQVLVAYRNKHRSGD